jgi:divalent metal cation (Fe/Co/Zn/Cd) transporter
MAASSRKAIYAALIGNTLIAITKFVAAAITGSAAMLSEGVHSLVDTGNQILLLLGMKRAARPPSSDFPFGHGKEVYFWSFVVAIPGTANLPFKARLLTSPRRALYPSSSHTRRPTTP